VRIGPAGRSDQAAHVDREYRNAAEGEQVAGLGQVVDKAEAISEGIADADTVDLVRDGSDEPDQVLASGDAGKITAQFPHPRDEDVMAPALAIGHAGAETQARVAALALDCIEQHLRIAAEVLHKVHTVIELEDRHRGARRGMLYVVDDLLVGIHLRLDGSVESIEQDDRRSIAVGSGDGVRESVSREFGRIFQLSEGPGIVFFEALENLGSAILKDGEITLLKAFYGVAPGVDDGDVEDDGAGNCPEGRDGRRGLRVLRGGWISGRRGLLTLKPEAACQESHRSQYDSEIPDPHEMPPQGPMGRVLSTSRPAVTYLTVRREDGDIGEAPVRKPPQRYPAALV
jgi:hypothetical protein